MQANNTYSTTETRCETVYDSNDKVVGYQVDYTIGEEAGSVRMDHNPGNQIPLREGQLVLSKQ